MILLQKWTIRRITKKLKFLHQNRQLNQPTDEMLAKEIALYQTLTQVYKSLKNRKKFPFKDIMVRECLRAAGSLDVPDAQYELALSLLEEAKFRDALEKDGLFANASNARQARALFEEANAYLISADNLGHALAKRMRGLCLINGWGMEMDKDKGFELVVASIDAENAWDRVPQIFSSIGLNKQEFFTELGSHRGQKKQESSSSSL